MKKAYKSDLKPLLRKYPPLAILYAWVCFLVLIPICTPGVVITDGWSQVRKYYAEVIPVMFWQVEE